MTQDNSYLKEYILNAPASHDEHVKALKKLNNIHKYYLKKIEELQKENEELNNPQES